MSISTPITKMLGIQHPILLAGMGKTSGAPLAAAVCNAGGLGVIGGVGYTPGQLAEMIEELKNLLIDKSTPFGVDLLLPQVGGNARRTNADYTNGKLSELIDVVIAGGAKLFVSAVGVPPLWVVEKLHKNGILYANIVGAPRHAHKACKLGADLIIGQGGEAGGHTGEIPFSVLIPALADAVKGYKSPLSGQPVGVVAAGGVFDGRSLAASIMLGAGAVWVGTRFVVAKESGASQFAKETLCKAGFNDVIRTTIFTGRPVRHYKTPYIDEWQNGRLQEQKELLAQGKIPLQYEIERLEKEGKTAEVEKIEDQTAFMPMGYVAGMVTKCNQPAGEIVNEMAEEAYQLLNRATSYTTSSSKL